MPSPALVGTLAVSLVIGGSVYAVTRDEPVTVARVVDGDTLDVLRDGEEVRIRLLNVDAPESVDPDTPVECLGPQASAYLQTLLPAGTQVRLEHDRELFDRYDRELAGVFRGDTLVNAEVARAGYGVPVLVEPNDRFYDEVAAGWVQAVDQGSGLMDPRVGCTPVHEVSAHEQSAHEAVAAAPGEGSELAELEAHVSLLVAQVAAGEATLSSLGDSEGVLGVSAPGRAAVEELRARVTAVDADLQSALAGARQRVTQEESRLEVEQEAVPRATPAPAPAAPSAQPAPVPSPSPEPRSGPRPGAGYTGCRAYIGGPYIDDQGRSYTPIDCTTRLSLVP